MTTEDLKQQQLEAELASLKEELRQERAKRVQAEGALQTREPLLTERIKEISCIYSVITLMTDTGYSSDEERLQDVVRMIPTGWRDPSDAYARIILDGKEYRTSNFRETLWMLRSPIITRNELRGALEVGYLHEKSPKDDGPFLLEERALSDVIARLLGEMTLAAQSPRQP